MIVWLLIGAVLGYVFHSQIDKLVYRVIRLIRDNRR